MNELQALVTGMLIGAILGQRAIDVTVYPQYDDEGNYLPEFLVQGNVTDTKLRVKVEVEE
jgi:hypothetical protein